MTRVKFNVGHLFSPKSRHALRIAGFIALVTTTLAAFELNAVFFTGIGGCVCLLLSVVLAFEESEKASPPVAPIKPSKSADSNLCEATKDSAQPTVPLRHSLHLSKLLAGHSFKGSADGIQVVTKDRKEANVLIGKDAEPNIIESETMASRFLREHLMNAKTRIYAAGVSLPFVNDLAKTDVELKRFAQRLKDQPTLSVQLIICNPLAPVLAVRDSSRYQLLESPPRKAAAETLRCLFDWKEQFRLDVPTLEVRVTNYPLPYGLLLIDDTITWNPTAVTIPGSQMPGIVQPSDSRIGGSLFRDFLAVWSDDRKCFRFDRRPTATDLLDLIDDDEALKLPDRDTIAFIRNLLESNPRVIPDQPMNV